MSDVRYCFMGMIKVNLRPAPALHPSAYSYLAFVLWLQGLAKSREFRKYMAMCIITVNLKAIFRHMDATLPKYQVR